MFYLIIVILVFILLILYNQHFSYILIVKYPQLIRWYLTLKYKHEYNNYLSLVKKIGLSKSIANSKTDLLNGPLFDNILLLDNIEITNYNLFNKRGSLPKIVNYFTTPTNLFGEWKADSLFRINYKDRGKDNLYKEYYLYPLQKEYLKEYRKIIRKYLKNNFNGHHMYIDFIHKLNIDLLYLLHFGELPSSEDYNSCILFIDVLRQYYKGNIFNSLLLKQIWHLKFFYKKTYNLIDNIDKNRITIISLWLKDGNLNKNQIFMEFIHNILGLTVNWSNLTYKYLIDLYTDKIPPIPKIQRQKYIHECFRYICPANFISSQIESPKKININLKDGDYQIITNLFNITRNTKYFGLNANEFDMYHIKNNFQNYTNKTNKRCPFLNTNKNAKVPCDLTILEQDGYVSFGQGYRRCPGEFLSMIYMEELAFIAKNNKYNIGLKENKSLDYYYIWDKIEGNYVININ